MVDVSQKKPTKRMASAKGQVSFSHEAYVAIREQGSPKGSIEAIAEVAGVMAAKRTAELIPLCHQLSISSVHVAVSPDDANAAFVVEARVTTTGRTGVEMEALTAASVACLTVYDVTKSIAKDAVIGPIELMAKSGGVSGDYRKDAPC